MGWLWILLFHPRSTLNGQWRALECKVKARGWQQSKGSHNDWATLQLSHCVTAGICSRLKWTSMEWISFFFFLPRPLSPSLPISIHQFSLFCYLEHVSADRSLQPISQCRLQRIVVMERPQLHRENYDQQSIAIDAHTSHTHTQYKPHNTPGFHHFDVIVTTPVFNQLPRPHTHFLHPVFSLSLCRLAR